MENEKIKNKLSIQEQINHMKQKGIVFDIDSEEQVKNYLENNTSYFKLRAYRKNYPQNKNGIYTNLNFKYLQDIASIDMQFRYVLLKMCLDIEHGIKILIINSITNKNDEDGYLSVREFEYWYPEKYSQILKRSKYNNYCCELYKNYKNNMPIWVFTEMLQFSETCMLYELLQEKLKLKDYKNNLHEIRKLRNACAHSNCILNNLTSKNKSEHKISKTLQTELNKIPNLSANSIKNKLCNPIISQIVMLLYLYKVFVKSKEMREHRIGELRELIFERINKNQKTIQSSVPLQSFFEFLQKVVDNWYHIE